MKDSWQWNEDDILRLIHDEVQENINLDYKACDSLAKTEGCKKEISKDVSAFANSAGGTIIYGVKEENQLPKGIDCGYDPQVISKEWLEQVINSRIQRRLDGIKINPVALNKTNSGKVIYVVYIPQSDRAPHMASDNRFYKRFNFQSVYMEEYEVRDLARREQYPTPHIVRAWFDTVLNPLLDLLKIEQEYLSKEKWTWRIHGSSLKELQSVGDPSLPISENLEQFLDSYPNMKEVIEDHDRAKKDVYRRCEILYQRIKESPVLPEVFQRVTSPGCLEKLRSKFANKIDQYETDADLLRGLFGGYDHLALIAEHIVNRTGELDSINRLEPFWNAYKNEFLEILIHPSIHSSWTDLSLAAKNLSECVDRFIDLLRKTRLQLARQHGVPFVVKAIEYLQPQALGSYRLF